MEKSYEEIREACIKKYQKLFKDSLVFDACEVEQELRIKLLTDPIYIAKTKAAKAKLWEDQIDMLDTVLAGTYAEEGKDNSPTILKALEMKNKLLLDDLNVNQDDSNAMNITFIAMSKEDFEALETVEIHEGGNGSVSLPSSFGKEAGEETAEDRMKKDAAKRLKELEETDEEEE